MTIFVWGGSRRLSGEVANLGRMRQNLDGIGLNAAQLDLQVANLGNRITPLKKDFLKGKRRALYIILSI